MDVDRRQFLKAGACLTGAAVLQSLSVTRFARAATKPSEVALMVDVTKCIGCWMCTLACRDCNSLHGPFSMDYRTPSHLDPDVWITLHTWKEGDKWHFLRQACMHCTDAACVNICPTGAVSHHELGFVQFDSEKCSGCGYCVEHCPFGVPQLDGNQVTGFTQMQKCVFCKDRVSHGEQPACAEACPTGATCFGDRAELLAVGQQKVAELKLTKPKANLYGADELGGLHVMYVLEESPEVYGLPLNPTPPDSITIHNVLENIGLGALAVAVAGFGLNYLVARLRISREGGNK